jgi:hypothetical protein
VKKLKNADGPDADKTEGIKLEFFMDLENSDSGTKSTGHFAIFKNRFPEE